MTTFNASVSGLRVSQRVIDMVAHNIANAETPGFKRFEEHNFEMGPFPYVSGVGTNIVRAEDALLDDQLQSATTNKQIADTIAESFDAIGAVPFDDLNTTYSKLMDATHLLLRTPNDTIAQQDFNSSAESFQKSLNSFSDRLEQVKSDITLKMSFANDRVAQIQSRLQELASSGMNETEVDSLKAELLQTTGSINAFRKVLNSIIPPIELAFNTASQFTKDSINSISGQDVFSANNTTNTITDFSTFNEEGLPEWDSHWFNTEIGRIRSVIGFGAKDADRAAASAGSYLDSVSAEAAGRYGVDLVEQQIKSMRYQRMYEANAQMIKTQDEMLGTLLSIRS